MNQNKYYLHKISNLINIQKIATLHYQKLQKNYLFKEESHDFWEINYADKGDITIGIDGQKILVKQGEMLFIKPNQPHFTETGDSQPNLFIITFLCKSQSMDFFINRKMVIPETYRYLLQNIMAEAKDTFVIPDFDPYLKKLQLKENANLGGEQVIKNSLETLLIYLLRHEQNYNLKQEFFVSKIADSTELEDEIVRILQSKIYGKFTLNDLKESLHYGTTKLCTFFRKKTGMSIYQTYMKLKIDEAKKLLRANNTLTEIADLLCFDGVSTFSYTFKKYTSLTPSEYKKSINLEK